MEVRTEEVFAHAGNVLDLLNGSANGSSPERVAA